MALMCYSSKVEHVDKLKPPPTPTNIFMIHFAEEVADARQMKWK
jgi:hypothetical protein